MRPRCRCSLAIGRERLHFEGFTGDMTLRKAVGLTKVSRATAPTPCPSPRAASRGSTGGSGNLAEELRLAWIGSCQEARCCAPAIR